MGRIVKKNYAEAVTDLNALSRYLEAMSAEGLKLKSIDLPFLLFEEGLPKKTRFNAVVVSDLAEADVNGYVSLCREVGWELVCRYSELFVFSTEDMTITDIDTETKLNVKVEMTKKRKWSWKHVLYFFIPAAAAFTLMIIIAVSKGCVQGCAELSKKQTSDSIEDANYWWETNPEDYVVSHYGFALMPVKSGNAVINDYLFSWYPTLLDDSIELFIDCTYSEEDYAREVRRLNSVDFCRITADSPNEDAVYGSGTFEATEGFLTTAIVGVLKRGEGAEYALLYEEENRIVYVYLQYWPRYRLDIDSLYLPDDDKIVLYHYAP